MEYKKMFTSRWFWIAVVVYSVITDMFNPVGITSFLGCLGFVFGSAIVVGIMFSIVWLITFFVKKGMRNKKR